VVDLQVAVDHSGEELRPPEIDTYRLRRGHSETGL
jgi:hypothetical protein